MITPLVPKRTIFLVDDHPMFRRGLSETINGEPDLWVCGQSSGENGTLEAVLQATPDLVVLDVTLRDRSGLDLLRDLLQARPDLRVLLVSMHEESLYAERALRAGARGYMMKHEEPTKMLRCIRQILDGKIYLSENASSGILQSITGQNEKGSRFAVDLLSQREFEVFELLAQGRTTSEIGTQLGLSVRTVIVHCANIRRKLNVKHAPELVAYAVRWMQSGGRL
jgi:DNA-binding NarL/FixJ family response regulator